MWDDYQTNEYIGMTAEMIPVKGHDGKWVHAYYSRPLGKETYPGIVLIPHMPGWDEFCRESARRFTEHGFAVRCPDICQEIIFCHDTL